MLGWLDRHRDALAMGLLVLIAAGAALWLARPRENQPLEIVLAATPTRSVPRVYVSGAVATPGVYALSQGSRVLDAIEAAGGATAEADLEAVNLAVRLRDEDHVHIPSRGSAAQTTPGRQGKLDINSASAAQLEALPGIGAVTARRILEHRERSGPFLQLEDLKREKLVTSATYDKIRELLTVN